MAQTNGSPTPFRDRVWNRKLRRGRVATHASVLFNLSYLMWISQPLGLEWPLSNAEISCRVQNNALQVFLICHALKQPDDALTHIFPSPWNFANFQQSIEKLKSLKSCLCQDFNRHPHDPHKRFCRAIFPLDRSTTWTPVLVLHDIDPLNCN